MRARSVLPFVICASCAAPFAAHAADEVQLPLPPAFARSLAWHQDPESVLRLFRVPRGPFAGAPAPLPTSRPVPRRELEKAPAAVQDPGELADVPVAADPLPFETKPSLAASPRRQNALAMAYVGAAFPTSPAVRCLVASSLDRGRTWARHVQLPTLDPMSNCEDPVVAYAPDGGRLYAAYREIAQVAGFLPGDPTMFRIEARVGIVVSSSADDGRTWSSPVVALAAVPYVVTYLCPGGTGTCGDTPVAIEPGTSFERPSLAVSALPPRRGTGKRSVVHVASTRLVEGDLGAEVPTAIVVGRSTDGGATWSDPRDLDAGLGSEPPVVTQGPRIAAGAGSEVLAAWYHSGPDGFLVGEFQIRTARSRDAGVTWDASVTAASDGSEPGLGLGPEQYFGRRWWTTMLPDVAIDAGGRAHVLYTHDPLADSVTAEEGDIRHIVSAGAPHASWSEPVTVNDDGGAYAQGFATLVARRVGHATALEAVWLDTRLAPVESPLLRFDVFHARLEPEAGSGWSASTRVTDVSSLQSTRAPGRTSVAANHSCVVFAAWGDRRGTDDVGSLVSDVYGSLIEP